MTLGVEFRSDASPSWVPPWGNCPFGPPPGPHLHLSLACGAVFGAHTVLLHRQYLHILIVNFKLTPRQNLLFLNKGEEAEWHNTLYVQNFAIFLDIAILTAHAHDTDTIDWHRIQ